MVQHIVMWKFKEGADPSEFLDRLAALEGVIPQLRAMQVRRTLTPGTGFDAALVADFDSLEDNTVTVRDRDTMSQVRVRVDELDNYLAKEFAY